MTVPLCKDCKHCFLPVSYRFSRAAGAYSINGNYVDARCALTDTVAGTGEAGRLCSDERGVTPTSYGYSCGYRGEHFEPLPLPPPGSTVMIQPQPVKANLLAQLALHSGSLTIILIITIAAIAAIFGEVR